MIKRDKSKFFIKEGFDKAVEEHMKTLELRYMYPFLKNGMEMDTYSVIGNRYNIKKQDNPIFNKRYKNKDKWQLIAEIHSELNSALRYLMVNHLDMQDGFHHQRMNALCYAQILNYGLVERGIKKYTQEEKTEYIEKCVKEHIDGCIPKRKMSPGDISKLKTLLEKNVRKYGMSRVIIKPLVDRNGKINYTLKELRAIHFMIAIGEFENLC
jgi:hypothetical protein